MIEVISAPENVAAFRVAGTVTAEDYDNVIPVIEEKLSEHQEIGILADLTELEDMTGDALRRDLQYGLSKLGEFHRFQRAAVVSDKQVDQGSCTDDGRAFPADRFTGVPGGRKGPGFGVGSTCSIAVSKRAAMPTIYNKRQDPDGLWEVYDEESEEAVVVDGLPLSGLDEIEANEAIRKLKRGEVTSDNIPPTAQSGWPPTKDGI